MADQQQLLVCAETALQNLQAAREKLASARSLGTLDIMGGGLLTSMFKHDRLREVGACLQAAGEDLRYLQNELPDLPMWADVDLGQQLKGFDIFLDNIFTDLSVQNKIKDAQNQVDQLIYQLQNVIARLKA